ncbi:glycosyltransferase family 9 protein [Spirosoma sordidisoli]|nr:glycosyltransferase family 9 protein [Spirosoma sordidisoli]
MLRFSAMGDVALLAPVVQAFTRQYPDARLTLVTRPRFAVFFQQFPNLEVVGVDFDGAYQGFAGLLRLFTELRQQPVDLVVDLHQNLRSMVLKSLFRLTGVSAVTLDKGRADKKALTRKHTKIRRALPHSVARYAYTFQKAGLTVRPDARFRFGSFAPAESELTAFLAKQTLIPEAPWLGIAPFAQHPQKMWPFDRFDPLLDKLLTTRPIQIFLFGGGLAEIAQLDALQRRFPQTIRVAGQLSMAAELALIQQLNGMVCMDSGNMHLAALSGVPVLSIWGATHTDAGFGPWGQGPEAVLEVSTDQLSCRPCSVFGNKPCWRGDLACLNDIPASAVAERVLGLLSRPH